MSEKEINRKKESDSKMPDRKCKKNRERERERKREGGERKRL